MSCVVPQEPGRAWRTIQEVGGKYVISAGCQYSVPRGRRLGAPRASLVLVGGGLSADYGDKQSGRAAERQPERQGFDSGRTDSRSHPKFQDRQGLSLPSQASRHLDACPLLQLHPPSTYSTTFVTLLLPSTTTSTLKAGSHLRRERGRPTCLRYNSAHSRTSSS